MSRIGIFFLWLVHWLPLSAQAVLGNMLGSLLFRFAGRRRRVGEINLQLCFPDWSNARRTQVLRDHFRCAARAALEHGVLWWSPVARVKRLVRFEGLDHLQGLIGQPVIVLAPHFVGLDMGGVRFTAEFAPIVSMYSRMKNPHFDRLMLHARTRFGGSKMFSRHDGVRPLVREVRHGLPLYYLPDQDFGAKDALFVPFFGVYAATVTALPRIARVAGARVVPCVTRQLPGGQGYLTRFYPAWDNFPSDDVEADTRRMNAFIEDRVLEMPEQYFWLHKRFKTRPPGEPRLYP